MRVGSWKDRHGGIYEISKNVIDNIAKNFNAADPPRITVGHPDPGVKAPVFGVVDKLKVIGDKLYFAPAKFCAEFAALVRRGGFPGVSAGLSRDLSRLDHVALLSAQKPAIDGLAPIAEFSSPVEPEASSIDVTETAAPDLAEFGADEDWVMWKLRNISDAFRAVKNFIIEKSTVEAADRLIPEYLLDDIKRDPPEPAAADEPEFSVSVGESAAATTNTPESTTDQPKDLLPRLQATYSLSGSLIKIP
jgi:hypothetical protein